MRIQELGKIVPKLGRMQASDVEYIFLSAKDMLLSTDNKAQAAGINLVKNMFTAHPHLLELQGSRLFKLIRLSSMKEEHKFKVADNATMTSSSANVWSCILHSWSRRKDSSHYSNIS
jgi:hypothetical protein